MSRTCTTCGVQLHGSNRCGVCLACQTSRTCIDCGVPVSVKSTGRCRTHAAKHVNADPAHRAATSERMKRRMADPAVLAKHIEVTGAGTRRAMQDPAFREKRRQQGLSVVATNLARGRSPEARAKAGPAISKARLRHIPADLRAMYRELKASNLSAAERGRIVLEHKRDADAKAVAEVRRRMAVAA